MRWRKGLSGESGGAVVELALALPLLVAIFAGTVDFARVFSSAITLTEAARAGAMYGAYSPARTSPTALAQARATALALIVPNTGTPAPDANASRNCTCATDAGVFTATTPANSCTTPEATACSGGRHRVTMITVTTTKTFTTIMGTIPGIPNSVSLTRTATLRVAN